MTRSGQFRNKYFWAIFIYAAVCILLFAGAAKLLYRYGSVSFQKGWTYVALDRLFLVETVQPNGPAHQKLLPGDIILAVDGSSSFANAGIRGAKIIQIPPADLYEIRISRDGIEHQYRLPARVSKDTRQLTSLLFIYFAAVVSFGIAVFVGLYRPDRIDVRLFAFTWMSVALLQLVEVITPLQTFLSGEEMKIAFGLWLLSFSPLGVATGYHFCLRFPSIKKEGRPWNFFKYILYTWTIGLAIAFTVVRSQLYFTPDKGREFFFRYFAWISVGESLIDPLLLFALSALIAVVARNYLQIRDVNERRRMKWVVYGSIIGLSPFLISSLANILGAGGSPIKLSATTLSRLYVAGNFSVVLIPLTTGYAIIKSRMFDIHVLVRRGVQYLFAKNVLRVLIYLPVVLVLIAIRSNRSMSIPQLLMSKTSYLLLFIAAITALLFRKNVLHALDRRFFREAYNSEQILMNLGNEIKNFNSMPEMAKWVTAQLESALHPSRVLVFFRNPERPEYSLGYSSSNEGVGLSISENSAWVRQMEREGKSLQLSSDKADVFPVQEREWLQEIGVLLAVPITGPDQRLSGLLLLGEKKSEEPYAPSDRKLLEALAGQMGIVYDNVQLREKVDQGQRVQREVLAHLTDKKRNLLKECPSCGTCYDSSSERCQLDGSALTLTLPVDRTIDSKYRLEKLIGRGGMGAVYRATDLRLARDVAIKIMVGSMFGDHQALRRFEREARASAKLHHPSIITVYDFGSIGEGAYLVMELLQGFNLRQVLEQEGNISPNVTANWFDCVLDAVQAAHQQGVIHRDLKPENILIVRNESGTAVKILDFGLAKVKLLDTLQSKSLTTPGTIVGTLHYMSPEQLVGSEVDERTDIFSIGVMVVEALTGAQPFRGNTTTEVAMAIIHGDFELSNSKEHEELDRVIRKCLAKKRDDRYATAAELRSALIPALRRAPDVAKKSVSAGASSISENSVENTKTVW